MSDQKIKIAMIGHKRVPSREGGIEVVVGELSKRMAEKGHKITCYNRTLRDKSAEPEDINCKEYEKIKIKPVWTIDKKGIAATTSSFSAAVLAAFGKYDIVHFHAEGPCAMIWIPKLFGKKCIATIHGLDHLRAKWGKFASWYIKLGEKCAARFADEIIVLSESAKTYFKDTYNRETIFIPNGASPAERVEADEITKNFGIKKDEYILFLGRLVPEKGVKYLIEAYKGLKTDKKLVIAGGISDCGEHLSELKMLADRDERIIFTGFVQGRILKELYSNAYIYVLPSEIEGMPLSLLEAMSFGNCCLTSDIKECVSVLGECGVVFKSKDTEDLRKALQELCSSPETVEKYKSSSAECVLEKYSWEDTTTHTLAVYGIKETSFEKSRKEALVK